MKAAEKLINQMRYIVKHFIFIVNLPILPVS